MTIHSSKKPTAKAVGTAQSQDMIGPSGLTAHGIHRSLGIINS